MIQAYKIFAAMVLFLGLTSGGFVTRDRWVPWLLGQASTKEPAAADTDWRQATGNSEQVKLSPKARDNLRMTSVPLQVTTYQKTIQIPAAVIDRPGVSDRGVVAPAVGIVATIHRHAGDVVSPGEPLFTIRLVGEALHTSQSELFKAVKGQEITQDEIDRLDGLAQSGGIPRSRIVELRNDLRRAAVTVHAHRQDLQIRGLSPSQIDSVAHGTFVLEVVVPVPATTAASTDSAPANMVRSDRATDVLLGSEPQVFEMQELAVQLGQHVQAGQNLCTLSHHQLLFIEGRAFQQEVALIQRAAAKSSPVQIELLEDEGHDWPDSIPPLVIHHVSNTLNDDKRTLSFYLPLVNQFRIYQRDAGTGLLWRFRPGQQVRLHMQVQMLENVFVLPAAAVAKEGLEFYVFRRNGNLFDRKPVHVLHQTQDDVVIANDGSLPPGIHVAQTGAVQLNRVLNSQSNSAPPGVHVHADGSVHTNH